MLDGKKTFLGLLVIVAPWLDQLYQWANSLPEGVLPEKARLVVSALGVLLAAYGRLVAVKKLV